MIICFAFFFGSAL